ncbi:MAG: DUF3368 domain-containing protein [Desulfobacteraceae bacterium]|nr:DUF3368 domain-containing protein [Desulfobacterales bacterium]MBL6967527.1 DUF3368 domain-containing protein [Desulfobacteraceae bacterium]
MSDIIVDTSPIQYLHQIGQLSLLARLSGSIIAPPQVVKELESGRDLGIDLPNIRTLNWVNVRSPQSIAALPLLKDLGPGETQVLALALELPGAVVIIDDNLARQVAESLNIKLMGTLRVLLDAKLAGMVPAVAPLLDQLQSLRFRVDQKTRLAVLKMAGEIVPNG